MTLREQLDQIEGWLKAGGPRGARFLWAILSALRGPDYAQGDNGRGPITGGLIKRETTARIRKLAFPRMTRDDGYNLGAAFATARVAEEGIVITSAAMNFSPHFCEHARQAAIALGLTATSTRPDVATVYTHPPTDPS